MESVWLRIKGHALCLNRRTLLIGACYAAPVSSKLYSPPGRRPGVSPPERVFGQLKALVQRYQSTDDELVILGDLNARVAKLRELPDAEADAELEIVAQVVVGSAGLLRGIPDRSCRDTENNAFGRSLVELCKEMELVILNGRVEGDLQGELTFWHKNGLGKSMIDLLITTPGLYYKAAELRVLSVPMAFTGPRAGDLMSDHCPVSLARDDASTLQSIGVALGKLGGEMNCTQVVQTIGNQLAGALDKAFGSKRVRVAVVREQKDAPWWTEECGLARLAMLDYKARMRAEGRMDDGVAKAEFSRLRTRYQRMRREAKERYRIDHFEGLMQELL